MNNENDKLNSDRQETNDHRPSTEGVNLSREDLLSVDAVNLSEISERTVDFDIVRPSELPQEGSLKFDELLSSIDNHPAVQGGILTFDTESNPGHTIVRVMLDDSGVQQAFDVGVFNGVGMDLNSLLGLVVSPDGGHS